MAAELPGDWEWLVAPPPVTIEPTPTPEIVAAMRAALDQLNGALSSLSAIPGVLGHNGLAGGVTLEEVNAISKQVDELKDVLAQPAADVDEVRSRWDPIWQWVSRLVRPAMKLITEGMLREGGKDLWDQVHQLAATWGAGQRFGVWLERLLDVLRGGS